MANFPILLTKLVFLNCWIRHTQIISIRNEQTLWEFFVALISLLHFIACRLTEKSAFLNFWPLRLDRLWNFFSSFKTALIIQFPSCLMYRRWSWPHPLGKGILSRSFLYFTSAYFISLFPSLRLERGLTNAQTPPISIIVIFPSDSGSIAFRFVVNKMPLI